MLTSVVLAALVVGLSTANAALPVGCQVSSGPSGNEHILESCDKPTSQDLDFGNLGLTGIAPRALYVLRAAFPPANLAATASAASPPPTCGPVSSCVKVLSFRVLAGCGDLPDLRCGERSRSCRSHSFLGNVVCCYRCRVCSQGGNHGARHHL